MSSSTRIHRIVVLGAGYTGVVCAIRVARRTRRAGGRVTLVNPSERFTERLRMHQLATGQELAEHSIPRLVAGLGVEFRRGRATAIDPRRREVTVSTGNGEARLGYETLVYAIGSVADPAPVPGAAEHAYTLDSPRSAARLAARLADLAGAAAGGAVTDETGAGGTAVSGTDAGGTAVSGTAAGGTVAVCGAGLTGVEAATEIAERYPRLRVVLLSRGAPGPLMHDRARRYLDRALRRLGVEVRAGVEVTVVRSDAVVLADGERVPVDACLWTTGFTAHPLAAESGLAVDDRNRIVVDPTLRSVSHPEVYAIGDAAAIREPWGTIHGTCQSGIPSGIHAADVIARDLRGRRGRPFRFGYVHQPVSLGRGDAVIQFTHADDSPRRWYLAGRWAVAYKECVTASPTATYRLLRRVDLPGRFLSLPGGRATRRAR